MSSRRTGKTLVRVISKTQRPESSEIEWIPVGRAEPPPPPPALFDLVFFSDVHSCTPTGDAQQYAALRMVDIVDCNDEVCGGPGGWLGWWSNDPDATPDDPDNPLNPYK